MDDNFGVDVELSMVVPNKIDRRTKLSKEYLREFRDAYPDVLGRPIPVSQEIRNAANDGHTVYDIEEPSKTGERARSRFSENAEELRQRVRDSEAQARREAVSDD
ncbi:MAG: ParA family protein, partial [Halobacteriales archaeon]